MRLLLIHVPIVHQRWIVYENAALFAGFATLVSEDGTAIVYCIGNLTSLVYASIRIPSLVDDIFRAGCDKIINCLLCGKTNQKINFVCHTPVDAIVFRLQARQTSRVVLSNASVPLPLTNFHLIIQPSKACNQL
jgi:hypothetical protein